MSKFNPHPFIKWAGGKTKLLLQVIELVGDRLIDRYFEPFLGGGAVFFELSKRKKFSCATIGDSNPELVNAYRVVRDNVSELIDSLSRFSYDKQLYLEVRSQRVEDLTQLERAARFIYLNRTCFNGLYRVNSKGEFNVPFGKYTNPVICDSENLTAVSKALSGVEIVNSDFGSLAELAKLGDLVYFDPPYIPISNTSNFTGYTKNGFGINEHEKLARIFSELDGKGVRVVLSNSYCDETMRLFSGFRIDKISASRNIGGSVSCRKPVIEVLVSGNQ